MELETGNFGHRPSGCLYHSNFRKYHSMFVCGNEEARQPMDSLPLGILLGFVAGYLVRALISQMRRRRFEEDYGFNPRSRLKSKM